MRLAQAMMVLLVAMSLTVQLSWAQMFDPHAIRQGMTLPEMVEAFGQPVRTEWLNVRGQAILIVYYPSQDGNAVKQADGTTLVPLGFITERLVGWGRSFYQRLIDSQ